MKNLVFLFLVASISTQLVCCQEKSKGVLDAFNTLNTRLEDVTAKTKANEDSLLYLIHKQHPEYLQKTKILVSVSDSLIGYIEDIKLWIVKDLKDPDDFSAMDESVVLDQLFFEENDISPKGKEFVNILNHYTENLTTTFSSTYPHFRQELVKNFDTTPVLDRHGVERDWLRYHFEGFPLIASKVKLTHFQHEIEMIKLKLLERIVSLKN
ncbi:MAG: hypothetical protein R2793_01545 [Flavobacteriaceae bacterium]